MKFKEIKPGMVIHCPKEEDVRALKEYLSSLGREHACIIPYPDTLRYCHIRDEKYYQWHGIWVSKRDDGIKKIEFSDLIEPDEDESLKNVYKRVNARSEEYLRAVAQRENSTGGEKSTEMTLDEAIAHCEEKTDCTACGREHAQLVEWLKELKAIKDSSTDSNTHPLDSSTEMSAVEVLEWLNGKSGSDAMAEVFGIENGTSKHRVIEWFEPQEIVDKITAYETKKENRQK